MKQVTVDAIRNWELAAGESFTDYFLDDYSYDGRWVEFLKSVGMKGVIAMIEEDGGQYGCTDQQLKFEPFTSAHENIYGEWEEEPYRKDVALWVEFINAHEDILKECEEFLCKWLERD